ncbi:MAG: accessory factor UbiK family protein [Devosiaceae bacterium]|nr:accessory factor UbiK family protein [Devosiaceae bacterium]
MGQGSKVFDDIGRLMNDAAGVADGVRREAETVFKSQMERIVADMDLVSREDYDVLREIVEVQGEEIAMLQKELASFRTRKKPTSKPVSKPTK